MILFYALGGGLGHLTRARAVVHTLRLDEPVVFLSGSPWADDPRVVGDWERLPIPEPVRPSKKSAHFRRWLQDAVHRLAPRALYVDAFPGGLWGELCDLELPRRLERVHIARLLRWEPYRRLLPGSCPAYDRTLIVEPLAPEHQRALELGSGEVAMLALADAPALPTPRCGSSGPPAGAWLIVHSGPDGEIADLVAYAREVARLEGVTSPPLAVIAPAAPAPRSAPSASAGAATPLAGGTDSRSPITHHPRERSDATARTCPPGPVACRADGMPSRFDLFPAWPMFAAAGRIFTGCGFNAMRQAAPLRDRHHFLPFPRRFDDQFRRAARHRAAACGG